MGRMLGFFESFPFLFRRSRPWAFVGSVVLSGVCVFKSGLSTPIRVSLIVAPDTMVHLTAGNRSGLTGYRSNRSGPVPVWTGTKPVQIQNSNLNSKKIKNS